MTELDDTQEPSGLEKPPVRGETRAAVEDSLIAGLTLIPGIGGPISAGFTSYFQRAHGEKMQVWYESVATSFNNLKADFKKLADDSVVRDTLISAMRIAETTSREEKLDALRAAVINSSFPDRPSEEKRMRFLRLVEQMVPEHIAVLKSHPMHLGGDGLWEVFGGQARDYDMESRLHFDLEEWKLAQFAGVLDQNGRPAWDGTLTQLGSDFLAFISEPRD